jgi:hypothetical protein
MLGGSGFETAPVPIFSHWKSEDMLAVLKLCQVKTVEVLPDELWGRPELGIHCCALGLRLYKYKSSMLRKKWLRCLEVFVIFLTSWRGIRIRFNQARCKNIATGHLKVSAT